MKWFNNARAWFPGSESDPDGFVHYSPIQIEGYKKLIEDEEVEYGIIQASQGPQGDNVTRIQAGGVQCKPKSSFAGLIKVF